MGPTTRRTFLALGAALALLAPAAAPAAWPERPITMIIAYSPGGGTDIVARAMVPYIEKYLGGGAKIVVQNRPGAGGEIGFTALAAAPPDGYTIGFVNTPNVLTIPIERKTQYQWNSFDLLGNIVDDPGNFSVHAESPVKSLADLAALARSKPGEVTVGTTGVGSDDHLAMLLFQRIANVRMNHIPMKGAADVRTGIVGRQIDVAAMNIGEAMQASAGGAPMRHLGQMSAARTTLAPNVPTFKEQGYAIELASLRGMAAPKGLPADVREKLVKAVQQAAADPEFQAKAVGFYSPIRYLSPAQFEAVMRAADAEFRQLFKEMPWGDK
ncbi:MAG TPA: tripartite tricarboxylate transporter substrate binding protein [Usitatibacter sp.]|nr:tripartite tricarboxylate transporter substrate binding protein [Usitatibacter sp.]